MSKSIKLKNDVYLDRLSIAKDVKMEVIWDAGAVFGNDFTLPNSYINYDILLFHCMTSYNTNGYIILTKNDFNKNRNYSVVLWAGNYEIYNILPSSIPLIQTSTNGSGGTIIKCIGIKLNR